MKNILFILIALAGLVIIWKSQESRLNQYNKYQCAVYGYEEDCKTALPEERRLK